MITQADDLMRAHKPGDAFLVYQNAWDELRSDLDKTQQVWLLLSIANAAIRHGDHEEALAALSALLEQYADTGIVAGNPMC